MPNPKEPNQKQIIFWHGGRRYGSEDGNGGGEIYTYKQNTAIIIAGESEIDKQPDTSNYFELRNFNLVIFYFQIFLNICFII